MADAIDAWVRAVEYKRGRASRRLLSHVAMVEEYLGPELAISITRDRALRWMQEQERDGYAKATAVTRAGFLRAALYLAYEDGRLAKPPSIPAIDPKNARTGFLEPAEVDAITAHLPWPYNEIVRLLHMTGWREREIRGLRWENIEWRPLATILLPDSKTGEPGRIEMVGDVLDLMRRAWAQRSFAIAGGAVSISPMVFHRNGRGVAYETLLKRWHRARLAAGVQHRVPHDLRRSMAKDGSDAGYDQASLMALGRWKSSSMFRRYRIVDARRTSEVLGGRQAYRRQSRTNDADSAKG